VLETLQKKIVAIFVYAVFNFWPKIK